MAVNYYSYVTAMSFTPSLSSNYYVDTLDSAKSSNIHSRKNRKKVEGPHTAASCSYESKLVGG